MTYDGCAPCKNEKDIKTWKTPIAAPVPDASLITLCHIKVVKKISYNQGGIWELVGQSVIVRGRPLPYGTKSGHFETSNHSLFHELESAWVSKRGNEWAQRSAWAKQAGQSSEWWKRISQRTRKRPSIFVPMLDCSEPLCRGFNSNYALNFVGANLSIKYLSIFLWWIVLKRFSIIVESLPHQLWTALKNIHATKSWFIVIALCLFQYSRDLDRLSRTFSFLWNKKNNALRKPFFLERDAMYDSKTTNGMKKIS